MSFLAPDGEELRNKRQLDKYLKDHPGSLTASDFDWHSGVLSLLFVFAHSSTVLELLDITIGFEGCTSCY